MHLTVSGSTGWVSQATKHRFSSHVTPQKGSTLHLSPSSTFALSCRVNKVEMIEPQKDVTRSNDTPCQRHVLFVMWLPRLPTVPMLMCIVVGRVCSIIRPFDPSFDAPFHNPLTRGKPCTTKI